MDINHYGFLYSVGMLCGLMICLKGGHWLGRKHKLREKDETGNALDGIVFALLGLLSAFSFSEALTSYHAHRNLLTQEAHNISEMYQRVDLLPTDMQNPLRILIRQYAQARLLATNAKIGSQQEIEALENSAELVDKIWDHIVDFTQQQKHPTVIPLVVASFTAMSGASDDQIAEQQNNVPQIIYILIFALALMAALLAGFALSKKAKLPYIRITMFALAVAITMYTIIDLENPRTGFLNALAHNTVLEDAIANMNQ